MVVDYLSMSSVNFAIPDFCLMTPDVPSSGRQFSGRATLRLHYPLCMQSSYPASAKYAKDGAPAAVVASAEGHSACVNRFQKLLDHGQAGSTPQKKVCRPYAQSLHFTFLDCVSCHPGDSYLS